MIVFHFIFFRIAGPEKPYFCSFPILYGPYVDTVGKNTKAIKEYIENQLKTDRESDQISLYDPRDPFTGSK